MASITNSEGNSLDKISQENHDSDGVQQNDQSIHEGETEVAQECPEGICDGSGEVTTDELDPDSGQYMRGVGTQKCLCQKQ